MHQSYRQADSNSFTKKFSQIIEKYKLEKNNILPIRISDFRIDYHDRVVSTTKFLNSEVSIKYGFNYEKKIKICWNDPEVISSFLAFSRSDSITVDPHKLGYIHYPCGAVAFRNDRIRHFISHDAPYITSMEQNVLLHNPPRHIKDMSFENIEKNIIERDLRINISSFARYMLEGSKPGSAAASLKLVTSVIPVTRDGYGEIIKQSLMAALEFWEWIVSWEDICKTTPSLQHSYKIVPVSASKPDTSLVVFAICPINFKGDDPVKVMNALTKKVYDKFTIQAEFGSREFSYSQPFFLSKEPFKPPTYNYDNLKSFFHEKNKCGLSERYAAIIKKSLDTEEGLTVLRATIMNPYLHSFSTLTDQNIFVEFFTELHKCLK